MSTIIYTSGMVILWVLNLVKGTGLGHAYNVLDLTKLLCVVFAVIFALRKFRKERRLAVSQEIFYTATAMIIVFLAVSVANGYRLASLEYLWVYLIVFALSVTRPSEKVFRLVGLAYAAMGVVVMAVYVYTDFMKGWDGNSVAMVGLSSFLIFLIPYYDVRDIRSKLVLTLAGVVFGVLFIGTGSRSCIFAAALALLVFFRVISISGILKSGKALVVIMLIPLLVSASVVILSAVIDMSALNEWSIEHYSKPFFNGRDIAWVDGYEQLRGRLWFGSGYIHAGYWHNSALACLTAYGVVGYLLWTNLFRIFLSSGKQYSWDTCTAGCMAAFLVVYVQQSVELGLLAPNPNILPYAMLGLLLGRVQRLRDDT